MYTSDNEMPLQETSTGGCTNPYFGWTKYMTEQILPACPMQTPTGP